jgi:thioredoxin 1
MIQEITSSDFENILNEPSKMILIDFYMPYGCGPCDIMLKVLSDYSEKNNHDHLLFKIDATNEENTSLCLKYAIRQVPTLLLFKNGNVIDKNIGALNLNKLIEFIEKHKKNN